MTTKGDNVKDEIKPVRAWAVIQKREMYIHAASVYGHKPVCYEDELLLEVILVPASQSEESDYPTKEAYESACKALWKHRDENEQLQSKIASLEKRDKDAGWLIAFHLDHVQSLEAKVKDLSEKLKGQTEAFNEQCDLTIQAQEIGSAYCAHAKSIDSKLSDQEAVINKAQELMEELYRSYANCCVGKPIYISATETLSHGFRRVLDEITSLRKETSKEEGTK